MRLTVGGYAPAGSSHGAGLAAFRDGVVRRTAGDVEVEVVWNILDEGRPATDLLEMVEAGEMFMCYFSSSYLGGRVAALDVLETPFLFGDLDEAHAALDGALGMTLTEATRRATGFDVLGYWDNGFRHLTNRRHPVHTPADCSGMRVRVQPNRRHAQMVEAWGGVPVPVELSQALDLIRSGSVDAQENPLANTVAYGVDRVHPYVTLTAHLFGARGLYVDRESLERLPPDVADVVRASAAEAVAVQRDSAADGEHRLRSELAAAGVEIVDLTPAGRAAFAEVSAPVVADMMAELGGELFDLATSASPGRGRNGSREASHPRGPTDGPASERRRG